MKKVIALAALVAMSGVYARELVSVDIARLITESKQGQELRKRIDSEVEQLQQYQNTEVAKLQEKNNDLLKQSKALDVDVLNNKLMALKMEERRLQRELQARQEDIQTMMQSEQEMLRRKVTTAATSMREEKGWAGVFDSSAPYVLAAGNDVTGEVLGRMDSDFTDVAVNDDVRGA